MSRNNETTKLNKVCSHNKISMSNSGSIDRTVSKTEGGKWELTYFDFDIDNTDAMAGTYSCEDCGASLTQAEVDNIVPSYNNNNYTLTGSN